MSSPALHSRLASAGVLAAATLAGCGRIGFAAPANDDAASPGHDEDGDGVPDAVDDCPYLAAPQLDSDGDGVGDLCDPEPTIARQRVTLFATLAPSDQPWQLDAGAWTQQADGISFDGSGYGGAHVPLTLGSARVVIGADLKSIEIAGAQHQIALALAETPAAPVVFFSEVNEGSNFAYASVTRYEGGLYSHPASHNLAGPIHPGSFVLQSTHIIGTSVEIVAGWPGEIYDETAVTTTYQGADHISLDVNNIALTIRFLYVVETL